MTIWTSNTTTGDHLIATHSLVWSKLHTHKRLQARLTWVHRARLSQVYCKHSSRWDTNTFQEMHLVWPCIDYNQNKALKHLTFRKCTVIPLCRVGHQEGVCQACLTWATELLCLATWSIRLASLNQSTATSCISGSPAGVCHQRFVSSDVGCRPLNRGAKPSEVFKNYEQMQYPHVTAFMKEQSNKYTWQMSGRDRLTFDLSSRKRLLRTRKPLLSGILQQFFPFSWSPLFKEPWYIDKSKASGGGSISSAEIAMNKVSGFQSHGGKMSNNVLQLSIRHEHLQKPTCVPKFSHTQT